MNKTEFNNSSPLEGEARRSRGEGEMKNPPSAE